MSDKPLTPFDRWMFSDVALTTILGSAIGNSLTGGSWLAGAAIGLVASVPALIFAAIVAAIVATPPTYLRALLLWAIYAVCAAEAARSATGHSTFGLYFGGAVFLYGAARAIHILRTMPLLPDEPAPVAAVAAPAPVAAPPINAEHPPVPQDLSPEVTAIADAAVQDFRHLCDALSDPALARAAGVDVDGMRGEANQLLRDILRRAPLVTRVRKIAAERAGDLDSVRAGDDALAALKRQADALRAATAAALRLAAAEQVDPTSLREHTENLHLLREAREDAAVP